MKEDIFQLMSKGAMSASGVGAVANLIPGIFQAIQGGKDRRLAEELMAQDRPQFEISEFDKKALKTALLRNLDPSLPGQALIEERVGEQTGSALKAIQETASSPAEAAAAMVGAVRGGQDVMGDVGIAAAGQKISNERQLIEQYGKMGMLEGKQFDINELMPYLQDMQAASALLGSSEQNVYGALSSFSEIAPQLVGSAATYGIEQKLIDEYFKDGGDEAATDGFNQLFHEYTPHDTTEPGQNQNFNMWDNKFGDITPFIERPRY